MLLSVFRVSGHSMMPTIHPQAIVLVSFLPYFFLKPVIGDIVMFVDKNTQKKLIKRIQKIQKQTYYVSGDNRNDSLELGWIQKREILGKVIFKIQ